MPTGTRVLAATTDASSKSSGTAQAIVWVIFGLIALFMVHGFIRRLGRFSLDSSDISKMRAGGHRYQVNTYTGRLKDPTKRGETLVSGSSYVSGQIYEGTGSIRGGGTITSRTIVHDQFFLEDANGQERSFQIHGMNLALAQDHLVSAVWAIRPGKNSGPYLFVRNHTTNTVAYSDAGMKQLARGSKVPYVLLCILWFLLFLPFFIVLVVVPRWRIKSFKSSGVNALVAKLDATAATLGPHRSALNVAAAAPAAAYAGAPLPPPPAPPAPSPTPPPPNTAGWFPDSGRRHQLRYWDGTRWTEHVCDHGVTSTDPV